MSWLIYPVRLLRALAARIERLRAGDSLRAATEMAIGSGTLERRSATQIYNEWERTALGTRRRRSSAAELRAAAAAFGITVVTGE